MQNWQRQKRFWKPNKRKSNTYHTIPKSKKIRTQQADFPRVMPWGGRLDDTYLQNTCTIDNPLTILHLRSTETPPIHYRNADGQ